MITKKITEVQNFSNGDLGTIIQVQGDEIGQTSVSTLKQDITNSVVSELTQQGGVSLNLVNIKGVVPTYADLPTIDVSVNDAYQVEADGLVYVYTESGFQAEGEGFAVQPDPTGIVEEGNTQAVSGGEVFDTIMEFAELQESSKNKANPVGLLGGYYFTNGGKSNSLNWIHWYGDLKPNTQYTVSGLFLLPSDVARIVFFDDNNTFISIILATGNANNVTFTTPNNQFRTAINLQNAVNVGVNPQESIFATTLQIEEGSTTTSYVPYVEEKIVIDYKTLINRPISSDAYKDVYFSYDKIGGTSSKGLLMVFVKRIGSIDEFVGFFVNHGYDMTDAIYSDHWRIEKAHNYVFNGNNMIMTLEYGGLYLGESEFVYKRTVPDSADFTGGVHGDEIQTLFGILINGIEIDTEINIPLTSAEEVSYYQKSNMYRTANIGETIETHDIQATHAKITSFKKGGYHTFNRIKFTSQVEGYIYGGISCVGKNNATYMFNEELNKVQVLSNNVTNKINGYGLREVNYTNSTSKYGAKVVSKQLNNENMDKLNRLMVHDRPNDVKYYRGSPTQIMPINSVYEFETKVDFFC